jgi:serine/threonine protein kinase
MRDEPGMTYDDTARSAFSRRTSRKDIFVDQLPPGTIVADRYQIQNVVGQGGMGVVYRARQLGIERSVAVKVLRPGSGASREHLNRFRREAVSLGRLQHPNIVSVYDFGLLPDERAYIAMEYLPGPTVEAWLGGNGPLLTAHAVSVARAVCEAVHVAHVRGVIHRDLKPSNIVLPSADEQMGVVKVLDFGIARLRERDGHSSDEQVLGTPGYLAPEIIAGEDADERSDIYAIGAILFEMLTGRPVFGGSDLQSVLTETTSSAPPRPSDIAPGIPAALDRVVLKALEKPREARWQTARELGDALATALSARLRSDAEDSPENDVRIPSILVVEDDESTLKLVEKVLRSCAYEVTPATDGIDALLKLGSARFDLIVSDINMPNLDGLTLLEMISKKGIRTPVIFLTGDESGEHETRGIRLGAADYLRKPFVPLVLKESVKRALEQERAHGS